MQITMMNIEQIWTEYKQALKRFLHSKIADADQVEDLLQEILIKTYQNIDTLKNEHSVKAWVFSIAHHVIIDFYRKQGRQTDITSASLWYEENFDSPTSELSLCVEPFIDALPQEQANMMKSIELNGVSQKAYAQQHNIAYSTLKFRVQKGRSQLKMLFEECCTFSLDSQGNLLDYKDKNNQCKKC